jgi:hypothetical protein
VFVHQLMQQHELAGLHQVARRRAAAQRGRSARFIDEGLAALTCGLASRPANDVFLAELVAWSNADEDTPALRDSASISWLICCVSAGGRVSGFIHCSAPG